MRPFRAGDIPVGGPGAYPMAQVICTNCGYTHLFNAVLAGIVSRADFPDGIVD